MAVHHIVVFRWKAGTTEAQVAAIEAELATIPALVPSIRTYHYGADLELGAGRWDFGLVAGFDDADGWRAYDEHPDHDRVRTDVLGPHVADRAAVQIGS
ncbi:MAG: Dabb family protein [Acidimicrobiales bacterium]